MDPFAPPTPSQTPQPGGPVCPSCGEPFDPATGTYDGAGQLICRACAAGAQSAAASSLITAHDPTTLRNLWGGAAASALLGTATCCISGLGVWFFVASIMPITSGAGVLYVLATEPKARETLGKGTLVVAGLAATGLCFGLLGTVLGVVLLGYGMAGR